MAANNKNTHPTPVRRILHFFVFRMLFPLCLLLLASISSLYLLCTYKPELIAASVQQQLNAATGLPWRIRGGIEPALWPYPGINASDVRIMAASNEQEYLANPSRPMVHAKNVLIYLDPASLWKWSLRLHLIELNEPVINLDYDAQNRPLWIPLDHMPGKETVDASHISSTSDGASGTGTGAALPDNALPVPAEEEEKAARDLRALADVMCSLPPMAFQPMNIRNGSLMSWTGDGQLLLSFTGVEARFDPMAEENLAFSAAFDLPDADLTIRFSVDARVGCEGIPAQGRVSGRLDMTPPGSRTLSALFSSRMVWQTNGKDILLPDFRISAEGDSLTADLVTDLASGECTGNVTIERLSLTRWFGWGRSLPPGLREALHHLTGTFDLQLDGTRAEAHNLRALARGLEVRGYVGAPDFSAPVVVVDIDLDRAMLDPVFPFLAAVGRYVPEPKPPVFDHPPLAPYPKDTSIPLPPPDPDGPPDPGVGYDIAIRVARPRVHDVDGGPLLVTVLPVTVGGLEKVRVGIKADRLLEGNVDAYLDIDDDAMLMHYDIKNMQLALLPENAENVVRIAGKVTGVCDIDVPFLPDGNLAEDWRMRVDAAIKDCIITGLHESSPWQLYASTAKASGASAIHAVLEHGVRIEGLWKLGVQGVNTSWHHKGNDAFSGTFSGGLFWPPITGSPGPPGTNTRNIEKKGVERVKGKLDLKGSLVVPLGSLRVPLTGSLNTNLDWLLYGETIALSGIDFNGLGSYFQGHVNVDFSGKEVVATSDTTFKVNPRELLKSWDLLPPPLFLAPRLLTGRTEITGKGRSLLFDKIKVEADGAPITGEISWQDTPPGESGPSEAGHWTFKLTADHLDIDNIFPPDPPGGTAAPPSLKPWNLKGIQDLSLDARLHLYRAKREKLSFTQTTITAALQKNRFSVHSETGGFYDGASTFLIQGGIVPETSQITMRKWLMQLRKVNFAKLLQDYTGEKHYGGTADLTVDIAGIMARDADFPAKLSGVWSLNITDGLYPAFLSGENSTLRNTFSLASASGTLDKGAIRSNNFKLSGPMVDMTGGGWYDLNNKAYDMDISATFAKVPTVPMRFYGNAREHRMSVRGADMVVETVQAAGSTMFGLVRGIISLPGHAVRGIGGLFGGSDTKKDKQDKQPSRTMPVNPGRGRPVYPQP